MSHDRRETLFPHAAKLPSSETWYAVGVLLIPILPGRSSPTDCILIRMDKSVSVEGAAAPLWLI